MGGETGDRGLAFSRIGVSHGGGCTTHDVGDDVMTGGRSEHIRRMCLYRYSVGRYIATQTIIF
jgi:hypothetical protein